MIYLQILNVNLKHYFNDGSCFLRFVVIVPVVKGPTQLQAKATIWIG